jgi:Amt family ammonium transporter
MNRLNLSRTAAVLALVSTAAHAQDASINQADTAWLMMSTALVVLMTPGLAFFYGGLVRSKNALNTMMMSFASLGAVGVAWALFGYSLAFAPGGKMLGGTDFFFLQGVGLEAKGTIPHLLFMGFQGTFAIITAALMSGAVVERKRFGPYLLFILLWSLLVYAPVAHWVWGGGWLAGLGALDFAGGTVVHVTAGITALVAALVLGPRKEFRVTEIVPHNVPFVLLGTAMLWFGWFGFNAGSALGANTTAALTLVNTMLAPMATLCVWMLADSLRSKKITAVGTAVAIVVGLVGITPAAGYVSPLSALILGGLVALPSYFAIHRWSHRVRLDDSLDVFASHGLGGITGAILTGFLAEEAHGGVNGLLFGNPGQVGVQLTAVLAVAAYTAVVSYALLKVLDLVMPVRILDANEGLGLDIAEHGESAYAGSGAAGENQAIA